MTQIDKHEFEVSTMNDEMSENGLTIWRDKNPRIAVIRTSDRISFKNCRRRWGWSSHLRHNLGPKAAITPLWFGSGMHFALEDYHGYNRFGHPAKAFAAYVKATMLHDPKSVPEEVEHLKDLGRDMMNYYVLWLKQRPQLPYRTYWVDGVPQVEISFKFDIPVRQELLDRFEVDRVVYSGTIDRICEDIEDGSLWAVDYKSAAAIATLHYMTDPQIGAYMWAMPYIYPGKTIGGFLYQQHKKSLPNPGRILKNGEVSLAQNQMTNHYMYKQSLLQQYGELSKASPDHIGYLNSLLRTEQPLSDDFIRIDKVYRNEHSAQAEGVKILMETEEMLDPNLALYPTPTRDCSSFCPFLSPCVSLDSGLDWKQELDLLMKPRDTVYDSWRKKLVWPDQVEDDAPMSDYFKLDDDDSTESEFPNTEQPEG